MVQLRSVTEIMPNYGNTERRRHCADDPFPHETKEMETPSRRLITGFYLETP